ncbi:VOC family protein [Brevibacterium daeguense]|uniref:VOC family protein n=1 Tax=Brevibacterium daeguense TaxID=909936 RepID=A0ABP8EKM7_9MICO|nr:VOC family protein [Brevibacterium daeguense]
MDFITGQPCWAELNAPDVTAAAEFYSDVFGWEFENQGEEFGNYHIALTRTDSGRAVIGGLGPCADVEDPRAWWSVHLHVDDIEEAYAQALELGAEAVSEPMEIGPPGSTAEIRDPSGAAIRLWQPGVRRGFDAVAQPGCPGWFDLHSKDFAAAEEFYSGWLGVSFEVPPGMDVNYASAKGVNGEYLFGLMDVAPFYPAEASSSWNVYDLVESSVATLQKAVDHGATMMMDGDPSPFGIITAFADPQGASIFAVGSE